MKVPAWASQVFITFYGLYLIVSLLFIAKDNVPLMPNFTSTSFGCAFFNVTLSEDE